MAGVPPITQAHPPALDNSLGAILLGVVVSAMSVAFRFFIANAEQDLNRLFGSTTQHVYYYYHYYPHDSPLQKIAVALLWILDGFHIGLTISALYHYSVRGFGNFFGLRRVLWCVWSVKLLVLINVVIVMIVQALYAYRVWRLSGFHNGVLRYLVAAVVLGGFAIGLVTAAETYTLETFADTTTISWAVEASLAASTTIDFLIAAAMCYYLSKSKGIGSVLNSRISLLMQYSLSCGVFTSACSISTLIAFILMPNNLIFLALTFLLTRLYVNSFLAMLNARRNHRNSPSSNAGQSEGPGSRSMGLPYSFTGHGSLAQRSMEIESITHSGPSQSNMLDLYYQQQQPRPTASTPMAMHTSGDFKTQNWSAPATVPAAARRFEHVYARQW
ncbi:NAD(P)-binding protein [Mycena indigotica]|uniref:NAD(P)-binding protein n=1 Tax=Mycena indigotica TaxID=2126181 RepID=A0A8H6W379_9AGAR|nr:NAD(P)-binding protein [Mycena indigotica]KAF7303944.1 NAD(P)-binding protein [Mycena indigotica]